jgi:hypothetical protein
MRSMGMAQPVGDTGASMLAFLAAARTIRYACVGCKCPFPLR